jgi:hypothetical protein
MVSLERKGTYQTTDKTKYQKLQKLLEQVQQSKTLFRRETPKPKGFGRLRK